MLSIGKIGMSPQQQMYYEAKVARGQDDYYSGRGEMPGRWTGAGGGLLGLEGVVSAPQLQAMMAGVDPVSGEQLANRGGNSSTAALDLTFSAPKSVSVLFALGDERLSGALVAAHEEAVDAALAYMEQEACRVRRGHNGTKHERELGDPRGWEKARSESAGGLVAAAYRHRMSRAQDPQLHTHVVCANMARGADGRWTALDGKAIYEHAKAGGSVYQAHLRRAVRERLPWASWGEVRNGMAELEQLPAGVLEEFSQRRQRILERQEELVGAGVSVGDHGRERITYDTRETKRDVSERDWREVVRVRASEHGLGQAELEQLSELPPAPAAAVVAEGELAARLFSPAGLTATSNTFAKRDVVIAVAAEHRNGADAAAVLAAAERMLQQPEVVEVPETPDARYTTRELLEAERRIVTHAEHGRDQAVAVLPHSHVDAVLLRLERPLTEEQQQAVTGVSASGNRIDSIEALAGTGKTTSAAALREVYEQAGYRVIGAAPTGRAVRELKERGAISESRTLDAWALKLAAEPDALTFARLSPGGVERQEAVMVIDEAGMAHTRLSATVIDHAMNAGVKVVAIGDSGQLSSVQAGGWLGALTRRLGSFELREVMRQNDPAERKGLARLHRGNPAEYLQLKSARGELQLFSGEQPALDAEQGAVERWAAAVDEHGLSEAVLICRDNERRERLNQLARAHLREQGVLGEQIEIAGRHWAVGDRVIARRNDRGRDLDNGMRGTVITVNEQYGLTIRIDSGQARHLDPEYVMAHVQHAYALTGHGMQGGTVQSAAVIGQPADFTRNWSYTALSRARQPTQVLIIDEPTRAQTDRAQIAPAASHGQSEPLERLARRMRERDDEDLALEQLEHAEQNAAVSPSLPTSAAVEHGQVPSPPALSVLEQLRDTNRELELLREQLGTAHSPVEQLRQRQQQLLAEVLELREQAVAQELAKRPPWLERTLGAEPDEPSRRRWQRTAREIAAHRIEHDITDPEIAVDPTVREIALTRSIRETRLALGLDAPGAEQDLGREY